LAKSRLTKAGKLPAALPEGHASDKPLLLIDVVELHVPHPRIRAQDWRSPLVLRLRGSTSYEDGNVNLVDSYRGPRSAADERVIGLTWAGLKDDFKKCVRSYQEPVLTEFATLGLACILIAGRLNLQITEVTRRGEKVDYWIGSRERGYKHMVLEVGGRQSGSIEDLATEKQEQVRENPWGKPGYICVAVYQHHAARLWYCDEGGAA
jgi:hypothetical protein